MSIDRLSSSESPTNQNLQACPFAAAFWEWPPLRPADVLEDSPSSGDGDGFEFVLVDALELLASVAGG